MLCAPYQVDSRGAVPPTPFPFVSAVHFSRIPTEERCVLTGGAGTKGGGVERFEPSSAMYKNTPVTPVTLQTTTQIKHQIPFYLYPK